MKHLQLKTKCLVSTILTLVLLLSYGAPFVSLVDAAFNEQINYQGKLSDSAGALVADGTYQIVFKLYTTSSGGAAIWTETRSGANEVQVTNGLFSVLLGEVNALTGVDFNQTLYLGVTIESDLEMTPRKKLGAVPAALEAKRLEGLNSAQFLRTDATNSTSTASTFLTISQSGAGKIVDFVGSSGGTAFNVTSAGNVGIGTSSPYAKLSVVGEVVASNFFATSTTATSTFAGGLVAGGTTGLSVLQNGNVGIGTITPSAKLDVNGGINMAGNLTFTGSGPLNYDITSSGWTGTLGLKQPADAGAVNIKAGSTPGSGSSIFLGGANNASSGIQFLTQDIERLRIDNTTGNIGIGTTSPYAKLSVVGNGFFSGNVTAANIIGSTSVDAGLYKIGGSNLITVSDTHLSVGIGASAGNHVNGANTVVGYGSTANSYFSTAFGYSSSVSDHSGTAVGASASAGAQGIAIGRNSSAATNGIALWGAAGANQFVAGGIYDAGVNDVYFGNGVTNASPYSFTLNPSGGSGTDIAGGNLTIAGGKGTGNALGGAVIFSTSNTGSSGATLQSLGEKMRLTVGGNLGIGTTSPYAKLSVVGQVVASHFFGTTTDTSTFGGNLAILGTGTTTSAGGINLSGGCFAVNGTCVGGSGGASSGTVNSGTTGQIPYYAADGTALTATSSLFMAANGYVGISTTNPLAKLHAGGAISDYNSADFSNTGAIITSVGVNQTAARTNALTLMRTGAGGVINAGSAAFDLSRWETSGTNARTQLDIRLAHETPNGPTDILSLQSGGNVGITTSNPTENLVITGASQSETADVMLRLQRLTTGGVYYNAIADFAVKAHNAGGAGNSFNPATQLDINLKTTGDNGFIADRTVMSMLSNGNVGIGTTSPYAKLSVVGQVVGQYFTATGTVASIFPYASTTALSVSGNAYFPGSGIWNASGNVGIGTSTPSAKLDITGTAGSADIFSISSSTSSKLLTVNSAGNLSLYGTSTDSGNYRRGLISQSSAGALTISSEGLGTGLTGNILNLTTNAAGPTLTLNGSEFYPSEPGGLPGAAVGLGSNTTGSPGYYRWLYGNFNGGTGSAAVGLNVFGSYTHGSLNRYAQFTQTSGGSAIINSTGISEVGTDISFQVNDDTKMTILNSGNVGIGTTSPYAKLSVKGSDTGNGLAFLTTNSSNVPKFSITDAGYVGIGVLDPQSLFSIKDGVATVRLERTGGVNSGYANIDFAPEGTLTSSNVQWGQGLYDGSASYKIWGYDGSDVVDRLVITTGGNVGIGTTSPYAKLSVVGQVVASHFFGTTTATSTFGGNLAILGTGTTTSAGGINLSAGCFAVNGTCVGGSGGAGSGTVNSGTTGQIPYYAANGTALSATSSLFMAANGFVGVGTTSPWAQLSIGTGDAVAMYNNTIAQKLGIRLGTAASPDQNTNPAFKVERIFSITDAIATANSVSGDGVENYSAITGIAKGINSTEVQPVGVSGFSLNDSASNPGGGGENDAVGIYGVGRITGSGTGAGIGAYFAGRRDNDTGKYTGLEVQAQNYGSLATTYNSTGYASNALWINANGNANTASGIIISNPFGRQFENGISFTAQVAGGFTGGVASSTIRDDSTSERSLLINGTHSLAAIGIKDGSGFVGIGTTTPAYLLDVNHATNGSTDALRVTSAFTKTKLLIENTATDGDPTIQFSLPGVRNWLMGVDDGDGDKFKISNTSNADFSGTQLTIDTSGNVGIGTTTPSAKLAITGTSGSTSDLFAVASSTNARFLTVTASGNVGVGTSTPLWQYHQEGTLTQTSGTVFGGLSTIFTNPASDSSASLIGNRTSFETTANAINYSGTLIALAPRIFHYGTGTIGDFRGTNLVAANQSTGVITSGYGGRFELRNDGAGTITTGRAGYFLLQNAVNNGTITTGYANYNQISNLGASSVISTAYGSAVDISGNSGTIGNTYGFYVGDITSGTQTNTPYSFYASDAGAYNYFAGNVGLGTTSPFAKLSIHANANETYNNTLFSIASSTSVATSSLFTVLANGNVGIGATNPGAKLQITSSGASVPDVYIAHTLANGSGASSYRPFFLFGNYTATDIASTTNGWEGVRSDMTYGAGGVASNGTVQTMTSNIIVQGNGEARNEHAPFFGNLRYDIGTGYTQTGGQAGRAWFADFNLQGPIEVQPDLFNGITMMTNNYYNGSPTSGPSGGMWLVTKKGAGGGNDDTHRNANTYAMDVGLGIVGKSTAGGVDGIGYNKAIQIGGYGSGWMESGTSTIGTGIDISDYQTYGLYIHGNRASAPGLVVGPDGGKVGIGTVAPTGKLEIKINSQDGANPVALRLWDNTVTSQWDFDIAQCTNCYAPGALSGDLLFRSTNSKNIRFTLDAGGTTLLNLMASGNVGIGTTSPYAKLSVHAGATDTYRSTLFNIASSTSAYATSSLFTVLANGNVGVGTTTPGTLLDLYQSTTGGAIIRVTNPTAGAGNFGQLQVTADIVNQGTYINALSSTWTTSGINVASGAVFSGNGTGGVALGAINASGNLRFYSGGQTDAQERMRITSAGNIGIGTTSPYAKLSIHANSNETYRETLFSIASSTSAATSSIFTILASGNVGIGTSTPSSNLSVVGAASSLELFNTNSTGQSWKFRAGASAFGVLDIFDSTAGISRLSINSTGNVGIGTTSPYAKLSVDGQVVASHFFGTTTATSTFGGNIAISGVGTSTSVGGFNLTGGCFSINNICIGGAGGGSGTVNTGTIGQVPYYAANGTALTATSSIFIATSGNVGIGTTTPADKLHVEGNIVIGSKPDSAIGWTTRSNAAGTITSGATASIASTSAMVVFNGSLYIGTTKANAAEIYRYDGTGTTWTKVTQTTAGTIASGGTANIDGISSMMVWNGQMYIGTNESAGAEVYRYDGGTTWTKVSNTTAGTIATSTTAINEVSAMGVVGGFLYVGTAKTGAAEMYRYNGVQPNSANNWVRVSHQTTAGTFSGLASNDRVAAIVSWNGDMYAAVNKANSATLFIYDGQLPTASGFTQVNTPGTFSGTGIGGTNVISAVDNIRTMAVYGGKIYLGIDDGAGTARVLKYDAYAHGLGTAFQQVSSSTVGVIAEDSGSQTGIDQVTSMSIYNDDLYIGTTDITGIAEVYKIDEASTWSKVSHATAGTIVTAGTSAITGVHSMVTYNDDLWIGTAKGVSAEVYSLNLTEGESYSLKFNAFSDDAGAELNGLKNFGTIEFNAEESGLSHTGNANTGKFVFSHGLNTATGAYDLAEDYATRDDTIEAGDLVSIDTAERTMVKKSTGKGDMNVIGIYSKEPALRLSQKDATIDGARAIPVALAGRVPVKVTLENGAIEIGDYLTVSSEAGKAAKAIRAGRVVGRALSAYSGAEGEAPFVTVFIGIENVTADDVKKAKVESEEIEGEVTENKDEFLESVKESVSDIAYAFIEKVENLSLIVTNKIVALVGNFEKIFANTLSILPGGEIKVPSGKDQISGSGEIVDGRTSVFIANTKVKINSQIIITPTTLTSVPLVVSEKIAGNGFKVEIAEHQNKNISFDWLMINTYDHSTATDENGDVVEEESKDEIDSEDVVISTENATTTSEGVIPPQVDSEDGEAIDSESDTEATESTESPTPDNTEDIPNTDTSLSETEDAPTSTEDDGDEPEIKEEEVIDDPKEEDPAEVNPVEDEPAAAE